jgi:hypothetical protein
MNERQSLPLPAELAQRIRECQAEIRATRKLLKLSKAAEDVANARARQGGGA